MATMAQIKSLRERTGAGILDCKKALTAANDDLDGAIAWLRERGISKAAKKSGRAATEGLVASYIHGNGRIGVLVEINAETDFVARNEQFQVLVNDIAMHIAAAAPEYVRREDVPQAAIDAERAIQIARTVAEGKPEHIAARIVDGRMGKLFFQQICLMEQPFVKDDSKTIEQLLTEAVATIGENIQIRRFARFVLGEGLEKKSDDFAAEVAAMSGQQ